ncbi:MAG: beta-3-deoxy-D-manno-oct-2-ulosonic acid transferase, partial [Proteobacteria bacterium]
MPLSILRAPPFPWADASVSDFSKAPPFLADAPKADAAKVFSLVREARVGGRFWADPAILGKPAEIVIRPRDIVDLATRLEASTASDRKNVLWIAPSSRQSWKRELNRLVTEGNGVWRGDVDPWSVLPGARTLLAHGNDEWVALARIAGVPVQVLSPGRFGAPGDNSTKLDELVAEDIASTAWRDPFNGESSTIEAVVDLLAMWRSILAGNRSIIAACGMAWW